ncbi:MAG: hypothetical protein ACP5R5_09825, partial [Armatimonadota bacterium]
MTASGIAALIFLLGALSGGSPETTVIALSGKTLPDNMVANDVRVEPTFRDGRPALSVHFKIAEWPNVLFKPVAGVWDWTKFAGLAVYVFNPEDEPVDFCLRVDNEGADGWNRCNTARGTAWPRRWSTLLLRFRSSQAGRFWGMRGIPGLGPPGECTPIDLSKITAFQVFLPRPGKEHTLLVSNIRLTGASPDTVRLPFVDRFGQYKHATWPGKLRSEKDLQSRCVREEAELRNAPEPPGLDRFGGWADGPQLEATGWFRTEKVNGKWWLVDPDGRLFFSADVDCVNTWDSTFVEKREDWFEWLPDERGPFKQAIGYASGVHSMAEPIGGKGRTVNFYIANLIRKYGTNWQARWREVSCARLRSWGF